MRAALGLASFAVESVGGLPGVGGRRQHMLPERLEHPNGLEDLACVGIGEQEILNHRANLDDAPGRVQQEGSKRYA